MTLSSTQSPLSIKPTKQHLKTNHSLPNTSNFTKSIKIPKPHQINGQFTHGFHPILFNMSKVTNFIHHTLKCAKFEHGFVSKQGENAIKNTQVEDCDSGSNRGEKRLYYLEERNEEVLSRRLLALSQRNKRKSALTLFDSIVFTGLKPDLHACNSLLSCFARCNMIDDMLKLFDYMKQCGVFSGHSFSIVLKAIGNVHGCDYAFELFLSWMDDSELRMCFDVVVYNTMISICGKENESVQMERVWKCMKESGHVGSEVTYRVLVCTFVRCGLYDVAITAYNEMLHNGVRPGYDSMHAVIGACMKEEKWGLGLCVFVGMLKFGLKPNLIACNALINSLGKAGKVKEAFNVYKYMKSLGHLPDSYTWKALLGACYRANGYENALELFEGLQNNKSVELNLHLYNTALMCCQKLGLWDKALQYLWKMEISGISVSTTSFNIVIRACEVARKPKVALQVYEHMFDRCCPPDTFTYLSLVRSCIWGDLWSEVEDILKESVPDVSLYNAAIHGMCLRGRIESAKKLYMKMREIGLTPDGKTRALMLQYMQKD